ncbi:MAG: glycosyltransferase family 4 protein [Bdellovibrionales bacterium]|nr:glycosyltransferase family 4 protein [Bdellovibrionales bacterium]
MKVLVLAPQPFFIERGTPIAVKLLLRALEQRSSEPVHLLTYAGGKAIELSKVIHSRAYAPPAYLTVGPGISVRKLVNDFFFCIALIKLLWQERKNQFQLIHAVEEAVFFAYLAKLVLRIPYVYDMDSTMSEQLIEKWSVLKPMKSLFESLEKITIRNANAIVAVCDSLAETAQEMGAQEVQILRDIPLTSTKQLERPISLRSELQLPPEAQIILYVGNLESYQGIDLLLDSFKRIAPRFPDTYCVIVGGSDEHQHNYREKVESLGLQTHFIIAGRRPVDLLNHYLEQATILASPRTKGTNTPMKIYSYLHSGVPVVATRLKTHTQVMSKETALLADPYPEAYAEALATLLENQSFALQLGEAAKRHARNNFTWEVFQRDLNALYDQLELGRQSTGGSSKLQTSS